MSFPGSQIVSVILPFFPDGGQDELCICHVQRGSLQFTVWLQLVPMHGLSLPYFRSFVISSLATSSPNLRPWYHAAKQWKDLISTDLATFECSQGCWGPLGWNEWGSLAQRASELWVMDTQAEGSGHSKTSGERGKDTEFVHFQETLLSVLPVLKSSLFSTIIKFQLRMTIPPFSSSQISF